MFSRRAVFLDFEAGQNERQFRLNSRSKGVKCICLSAITASNGGQVCVIDIDGISMAIDTENLAGYPVPIPHEGAGGGANQFLGHVFSPPLLLGMPARGSMQSFRVRLSNVDGTPYSGVNSTVQIWLELVLEPDVHDAPSIEAEQWLRALSGAGANDWRWDYVPDQASVAEYMATLNRRLFSKDKDK